MPLLPKSLARRTVLTVVGVAASVGFLAAPTPATASPAAPRPVRATIAVALPVQFADDGLGLEGTSTYAIDPPGRAIHVAVDLTAENLVAPSYGASYIRYAYYDQIGVPVLAEAVNFIATAADGTPLGVTIEAEEGHPVSFAVIDLPTVLNYQDVQQLHLTYDLPDQGPRAAGITRVNPAYAAVVPLPIGDPGFATVRVLVPEGLDVEQLGANPLAREPGGELMTFADPAIADPITWDATLVARDYDQLERTEVPGAHDVEVRAWPGDTAWSDFVSTHVQDGLPILEELIGRDWPVTRTLLIEETVSPYVYGYAGWYDPTAETIEIGDQLEPIVVLHELSHAWFNRELFGERWINEGLAEEYAARTLERMGQPLPQPDPVNLDDPGAIRLTDWSTPSLSSAVSDDHERYGYNAAFAVVRALFDEIGAEAMGRVIDAAADDRIAYQGDPEPEHYRRATEWKRFLDLLAEIGGSQQAEALFAAHVVPGDELALLAERGVARTALAALEDAGAGWTAPHAVRRAMATWSFPAATAAMEEARAVLAVRDQITAAVAPLGLTAPVGLERAYESADDLDEVLEQATALLDTADELVAAADAVHADRDVWARLGSMGGGADDALAEARTAFADGDADEVLTAAARTHDTVDRADDLGRAAVLATVLALVVAWFARQQHQELARRRRVTVGSTGAAQDSGRPPSEVAADGR